MSEIPPNIPHSPDMGVDLAEEFEWILFQRERPYPGASITVRSAESAPITRKEATLPEPGAREYRAFKRWQKGGLTQRVLDLFHRAE